MRTIAFLTVLLPSIAYSQNADFQALIDRVDRLQRELSTLQRQVYTKKGLGGGVQPMPISNEPSANIGSARNSIRLVELETEMQNLTGRFEKFDFQLRQMSSRLNKLVSDIDQRLTAIEGNIVGLKQPTNENSSKMASPSAEVVKDVPNNSTLGAPPRILGTIPLQKTPTSKTLGSMPDRNEEISGNNARYGGQPDIDLPPGSPKEQYEFIKSLMVNETDKAEKAWKYFIGKYPQDPHAASAYYWLAQTYYVRQRFQDAAFTFADGFQKHPKGPKASDSLLKLGMALSRLGQRVEACTTFSRLVENFPDAKPRILALTSRERRRAKCL